MTAHRVTIVPPEEYVAVDYGADKYCGDAITVESLADAHAPGAPDAFREWWDDNREGRFVAILPTQVGGIFVEDYLDWVARAVPGRADGTAPACRWCRGTGMVTLATSTKPCLDCGAATAPANKTTEGREDA